MKKTVTRRLALTLCLLLAPALRAEKRIVHAPAKSDQDVLDRFVDGTNDPELRDTQRRVAVAVESRKGPSFAAGQSGDFGEIAVFEDDGTLMYGGVGGISNSDAIVKRFFETHPDEYGQVFLNFNFPMDPEAGFAFESNIANDVQGIGLPIFNGGAPYGTVNLASYLNMNDLGEFPSFNSYNAILGQESEHRFAAFIELPDQSACSGNAGFLLGRQCAHWSFYCNSQGSTMEGNDWTDNGNGTFSSANAFTTYSEVDEYLMGLRPTSAIVMPLFVIQSPTGCIHNGNPQTCPSVGSGPSNNWTVTGTRTNYTMADVVTAYGPRVPDPTVASHTFRVAFLMVCPQGQYPPPAADLAKLDSFRTSWVTFYNTETNGLGTMETRLYLPGEPPHPTFYAAPTFAIPSTPIQFTDDTRNGPVTTWLWTFGDGSTSGAQSPTHSYAAPGLYDVSLTATNANGSDTRTRTGYLDIEARVPQAEFTADVTLGTAPLTVNFTDQTTWIPASWLWDFGDGSTSAGQNPIHTYTTPNTAYTVKLTATNTYGSNTRGRQNYVITGTPFLTEGFETGGTGWTHGANAGVDDWELGPPQQLGGDPATAHGGTNVYGTDLSQDGKYAPNVDTWLQSPAYDGTAATHVALNFWRWLTVEDATYDHARLFVDTTQVFQNPVGSGSNEFLDNTWTSTSADISKNAAGNPAFRLKFTLSSDPGLEFGGWNIDDLTLYSTSATLYTPGPRIVAGPGHGSGNPNQVSLFDAAGQGLLTFSAYSAGTMGTNVARGDIDGDTYGEIVTGPGPGTTLGPQVRAFNAWDGSPIAKVNYYAYGTLRYGVNAGTASLDSDRFDEILTGPGAGAVFGPHVRGWNHDGGPVTPIAKISYFAYGTLKYGCLVSSGQLDADTGFDEILTGAGPGSVFAAHLRGWNYDNTAITALPGISAFVFAGTQYGVNVAAGNYSGSARDEILAGKGPAVANDAALKAFLYSGTALTLLTGSDLVPFTSMYGVRVGGGQLGFIRDHLVAGPGPSPTAASQIKGYTYKIGNPQSWVADTNIDFTAFATQYGTIAAAGSAE